MALFVRRDLTDRVPTSEGEMHFVKRGAGYPVVLLHPLGTFGLDLGVCAGGDRGGGVYGVCL